MAWSDIQVSVDGVSGNDVTLSATNPNNQDETARIGIRVSLSGGTTVLLMSQNLSFAPYETKTVTLHAASSITSIEDSPEPFPPVV